MWTLVRIGGVGREIENQATRIGRRRRHSKSRRKESVVAGTYRIPPDTCEIVRQPGHGHQRVRSLLGCLSHEIISLTFSSLSWD